MCCKSYCLLKIITEYRMWSTAISFSALKVTFTFKVGGPIDNSKCNL